MTSHPEEPKPQSCGDNCRSAPSINALNRSCYCLTLDEAALRHALETDLGVRGLSGAMVETHPHLFASSTVFVARGHLEQMARVIQAVEAVVETTVYREAVLAWAPEIALFDPGVRGGLLGYDFHLTEAGPQLIEINTNGTYVAQALVAPSERQLADAAARTTLKVDLRNYAYAGEVKLVAARLYQGQTTNFRTPGGGFAPVLTRRDGLRTST